MTRVCLGASEEKRGRVFGSEKAEVESGIGPLAG